MTEIRTVVQTVMVNYRCPECEVGVLRATDRVLYTNPIQYPHECNKCWYKETFLKKYPYTEYI